MLSKSIDSYRKKCIWFSFRFLLYERYQSTQYIIIRRLTSQNTLERRNLKQKMGEVKVYNVWGMRLCDVPELQFWMKRSRSMFDKIEVISTAFHSIDYRWALLVATGSTLYRIYTVSKNAKSPERKSSYWMNSKLSMFVVTPRVWQKV